MRLAEEFDLTLQRALALRILGSGARSMRDLADGLFCGMSSLTALADRLAKRELVERQAGESDRRFKRLQAGGVGQ
jgi:DNA-binding MarR family transcriptional regulator